MSNYKQASKLQLRFQTNRGSLSVEQLWSLSLTDLASAIKAVKKVLKGADNDDELSFLDESKTVDTENQLRFNILKDVYVDKQTALKEARSAQDRKAYEQKILDLIAEKREGALKEKSIKELEALLKE